MDLETIKQSLRAEIKKRENEQYSTFQCNIRQMCRDVLSKLEEQETLIADMRKSADDKGYVWQEPDSWSGNKRGEWIAKPKE